MLFGIFSLLFVLLPTIMGQPAPTPPVCQSCNDDFNPVCTTGENDIPLTFPNECELRRHNCKYFSNLRISSGPCWQEYIEQTVQRLLRQQQQPGHFSGPRPNRRTRFGPRAGPSRAQNFQMFFKK